MDGTYSGAYWSNVSNYEPPRARKTYKVLSAKFKSSYHYHGSWFEYTYELVLEDEAGVISTQELYTTSSRKSWIGVHISSDGVDFTDYANEDL